MFMCYPFRNEQLLKAVNTGTYTEKLNEPGIIDIINANKQVFEHFGDMVDFSLLHFRTNIARNDAYSEQENDQLQQELLDTVNNLIHDWAKRYVNNLKTHTSVDIKPLHVFITGNGGCDKSNLIKTIYHSLTKTRIEQCRLINKKSITCGSDWCSSY